jgi:hypothetical protein
MVNRGDRDHDIAAWFGVNQGRIAEAKEGKFGPGKAASQETLPPKGPPGIKGRVLCGYAENSLALLEKGEFEAAKAELTKGLERYNKNET